MVEEDAFDPVSGQADALPWNHDIGKPAFSPHGLGMIVAGLMALATLGAPPAQPASARSATAAMSVGATVIRPEPQPLVAVQRASVTIRNAGSVIVSADGGTAQRLDGGTILVTPGAAGALTITFTY
jgi:hypothetical protein